jgi:hypothetical protein
MNGKSLIDHGAIRLSSPKFNNLDQDSTAVLKGLGQFSSRADRLSRVMQSGAGHCVIMITYRSSMQQSRRVHPIRFAA